MLSSVMMGIVPFSSAAVNHNLQYAFHLLKMQEMTLLTKHSFISLHCPCPEIKVISQGNEP